ncbi:MAG: type 1 glutamine amidotransferase [Kiritimatiellales bacterium]|nr:type 1 glutamine amidotransferase [Kiritimatiellales bacterium]
MKLHYLQHVTFEGLGIIEKWALDKGAAITCTRLFAGEKLPGIGTFDWLVIMGGPMGINGHDEHPWLGAEKEFIKEAIDSGKTVLGICLGAQLIADVLGAKVYPNAQKEIGWFPIHRSEDAPELLPETIEAFHWHGDTFDLPEGAVRLASSKACRNQGFIYGDRVIGLQFHLETTEASMNALIENCGGELVDAPFIQPLEKMREKVPNTCRGEVLQSRIGNINNAMKQLLDALHSE